MRSMQARSDEDSGGKEGFQESATEAFRLKSYDLSRQNISIEYGEKLRNQLDLTIKEIDILARSVILLPCVNVALLIQLLFAAFLIFKILSPVS